MLVVLYVWVERPSAWGGHVPDRPLHPYCGAPCAIWGSAMVCRSAPSGLLA